MRSFYGLIKQGEESVRAMGRGEGHYRYFRQVCLPKCRNRRGCLSMTVCTKVETQSPSSLKRGSLGPGRRICTQPRLYSSGAVALDQGLCVGVRRSRWQGQTQHNCCRAKRTGQFCGKISVLPCGANMAQYINFSKGYKILNEPEECWYYSCYVVGGRAKRGLPLGECHATKRYASTLHVPDLGRDRGNDGLRASPAAARRGGQAQTGAAVRCRAGFGVTATGYVSRVY